MRLHLATLTTLFLFSITLLATAARETNVTIHITDISAVTDSVSPTWIEVADGVGVANSDSHTMLSLKFIGTAIYLLSPKFLTQPTFLVSLDNAPPTIVEISSHSPSSTLQSISWSQTGLGNGEHTVVISTDLDNGALAIGGFIISQVISDANTTGQIFNVQQRSEGKDGPPPDQNKKKGLRLFGGSLPKTIGFIVGLLVGVILLAGLLIWWLFFGRKHDARKAGPVSFSQWATNFSKHPVTTDTSTTDVETGGSKQKNAPSVDTYQYIASTGPVFVLEEARKHRNSEGFGSRPSLERDPSVPRRSLQHIVADSRRNSGGPVNSSNPAPERDRSQSRQHRRPSTAPESHPSPPRQYHRRPSTGSSIVTSQASEALRSQPAMVDSQVEKAQLFRHLSTTTQATEIHPPVVLEAQTGITPPPAYTLP